jgi:hypothetical protein
VRVRDDAALRVRRERVVPRLPRAVRVTHAAHRLGAQRGRVGEGERRAVRVQRAARVAGVLEAPAVGDRLGRRSERRAGHHAIV